MKWYKKINVSLIIGIAYIGYFTLLISVQVGTHQPAYMITWEFPLYTVILLGMAFILGCATHIKRKKK